MDNNRHESPGIRFPPPLLFVGGIVVAYLLDGFWRFRFIEPDASTAPLETAGVLLIVFGLVLLVWAMITFTRAETAIMPSKPASKLVETGPYRISRNPMYTGLSALYLGLMLALNLGWALVTFPFVIVSLYRLVISREERYLLSAFGEEYAAYCRRVRRWI